MKPPALPGTQPTQGPTCLQHPWPFTSFMYGPGGIHIVKEPWVICNRGIWLRWWNVRQREWVRGLWGPALQEGPLVSTSSGWSGCGVWEGPSSCPGTDGGSLPRPLILGPRCGHSSPWTPVFQARSAGWWLGRPPQISHDKVRGESKTGTFFCAHLPPSGVERVISPWRGQEVPQGSPKEVTAPTLKDAGDPSSIVPGLLRPAAHPQSTP